MKRVIAIIMSFIMLLMIIPFGSLMASAATYQTSGKTGDCNWKIINGAFGYELHISGIGDMGDYYGNASPYTSPPYSYTSTGGIVFSKIVIEDGVECIGHEAFAGCYFKSITIPNSVEKIEASAFRYCKYFKDIIIPDSVTYIGAGAFAGCSDLTSIYLSANVSYMGPYVFGEYKSDDNPLDGNNTAVDTTAPVAQVWFGGSESDKENLKLKSDDRIHFAHWHYNTCSNHNHHYSNKCDRTCDWCEYKSDEKVTHYFTNSCDSTCNECGYVRSVSHSFVGEICSVCGIHKYTITYNGNGGINVPSSQEKLHDENLILSSEIPTREGYTFLGWSTSPQGNVEYEAGTIYSANITVTLYAIWAAPIIISGGCGENLSYILYADGKLVISGNGNMFDWYYSTPPWLLWANADTIKSVELKKGVNSIGAFAFSGCENLTNIIMSDTVTEIGMGAFQNCDKLTDIVIPNGVTKIDTGAFLGCKNLTSIIIPDSVTEIGWGVFGSCSNLKSISLPKNIVKLGMQSFAGCESLEKIEIPKNVVSIEREAFGYCKSLEMIIIPNGVKNIDEDVFCGCNCLKDVYFYGTKAEWDSIVIGTGNYNLLNATIHYDIQGIPVTGVSLNKTTTALTVGETETLTATVAPSNATNKNVLWYSSDTNIATVSNGVITAKNAGQATITVTTSDGSKTATCIITVNPLPKTLTSISISLLPSQTVYEIGETLNTSGLKLKLIYSDGSTEFVSSGFTISGFDSSTSGLKTVTVNYESKSTTFTVTVYAPNPTIYISPTTLNLNVGENSKLTATTTPSGQVVTWSSSNSYVATVNGGLVTAKAIGTATITAKFTYNGYTHSKTCNVTVKSVQKTLSSISISTMPSQTVYEIDQMLNTNGLELKLTYSDGSTKIVSTGFTTSGFNSSTSGTKTVTVNYEGKSTTFTVYVKAAIVLSASNLTLNVGDVSKLTATTSPSGQAVTWSSSNPYVATVSDGIVTAKSAGTTTIAAKIMRNGVTYHSAACKVTVNSVPKTLSSISINTMPSKIVYEIGESLNTSGLKLKLTYSDNSTEIVSTGFTTSGFTSLTSGTKTVTVNYDGKTTSFTVTVNEKEVVTDKPLITVSSHKCVAGNEIKVTVSMENNPGIVCMQLKVDYDSDVLSLVSITDAGILGQTNNQPQMTNPYYLNWENDTATENFTTNGKLVTLTFKVLENAPIGDSPITITCIPDMTMDKDFNEVEFAMGKGIVTVMDVMIGDVNSDGKINAADRMILSRYLANWQDYSEADINLLAADVNQDGKVNAADRMILSRYLAKWDGYDEIPYQK